MFVISLFDVKQKQMSYLNCDDYNETSEIEDIMTQDIDNARKFTQRGWALMELEELMSAISYTHFVNAKVVEIN